jgi:hypothetical protein
MNFSTDTDTGWFSPGADLIAVSTGGTERLRIDSSGYIGVGISAPETAMHLQSSQGTFTNERNSNNASGAHFTSRKSRGTSAAKTIVQDDDELGSFGAFGYNGNAWSPAARVLASVDGTPGDNDMPGRLEFQTTPDNTESIQTRMTVTSSGNVGIGTTTPTETLHVLSQGNLDGIRIDNGTAHVNTSLTFDTGTLAGDYEWRISAHGDGHAEGADKLSFQDGTTARMTIDSSGNVGIGTTLPTSRLTVSENTTITGVPAGTVAQFVGADASSTRIVLDTHGGTGSNIQLRATAGTAAAPSATQLNDILGQLSFNGYGATDFGSNGTSIRSIASENWTDAAQGAALTFRTSESGTVGSLTERMRIDDSGNVGIGTTSPAVNFHVDGADDIRTYTTTSKSDGVAQVFVGETSITGGNYGYLGHHGPTHATLPNVTILTGNDTGGLRIGSANDITMMPTGNVGIGTTDPSSRLEIADANGVSTKVSVSTYGTSVASTVRLRSGRGTATAPTASQITDDLGVFGISGHDGTSFAQSGSIVFRASENWTGSDQGADIIFKNTANGATSSSERMIIENTGHVGIGTVSPTNILHTSSAGGTGPRFETTSTSGTDYGITIKGARNASSKFDTAYTNYSIFDSNEGAGTEFIAARVSGGMDNVAGQEGVMQFSTNSGAGLVKNMIIDSAGNVGIGTDSPGTKLHVDGDMFSGTTYSGNPASNNVVGSVLRSSGIISVNRSAGVPMYVGRTNDGGVINFRSGGTSIGNISVSGGTVTYGAFTGVHYAYTDQELKLGQLVKLGDNHRYPSSIEQGIREPLYELASSTEKNSKKVFGSYVGLLNPDEPFDEVDNPHNFMAVGNGEVLVVNKGQDLKVGDYLISSDIPGYAELDNKEFDTAHIIARVAESISWDEVNEEIEGTKFKRVSVTFENFDKVYPNKENLEMFKLMQNGIDTEQDRKIASLESKLEKVEIENRDMKNQLNGIKEVLCAIKPESSICHTK